MSKCDITEVTVILVVWLVSSYISISTIQECNEKLMFCDGVL